jgi:ketosteroid isomerase-like protein
MSIPLIEPYMNKVITAGLLLLAARSAQAQDFPDSASVVRHIRAALANWVEAANRQDWKTAARIWAPDLVGWYPGQADDTYAKEIESAAHPRPGRPRTHYEVDVVEVMVSGGMAVVRDIWRFTTKPDTPNAAVTVVRSYEVWKRQNDGQWKIARWISAPEPSGRP